MVKATAFLLLWAGASVVAVVVAWQGVNVVDSHVIDPPSAPVVWRASGDAPLVVAGGHSPRLTEPTADIGTEASSPSPTPGFEIDLSHFATSRPTTPGLDTDAVAIVPGTGEAEAAPTARSTDPEPTATPTSPPAARATPDVRVSPTARPTATARPATEALPRSTPKPESVPTATSRPAAVPKPVVPTPTATSAPAPTRTPRPTATATPTPATQVLTFDLVGGSTAISFAPGAVHVMWASPNPGFTVEVSNSGPGVRVEFRSDDGRSRLDAWWDAGAQWEIREDHD